MLFGVWCVFVLWCEFVVIGGFGCVWFGLGVGVGCVIVVLGLCVEVL